MMSVPTIGVVGVALAFTFANPANAQMTTGKLLEFCASSDMSQRLACRYYITGVVEGTRNADGMVMKNDKFTFGKKTILCVPDGTPYGKLVEIFQVAANRVLQQRPDDGVLPAASTVTSVMVAAFPCK